MLFEHQVSGGRRPGGFTLIELMVAVLLGALLMLGAVTLFLQNKRSYVQDEELARLQESGRYTIRYLSRELSMAGFFGGLPGNYRIVNEVADPNDPECYPWLLDVEWSRQGLDHLNDVDADGNEAGTEDLPSDCLPDDVILEGTDILVVRRTKDTGIYRNGDPAPGVSGVSDPNAVYLELNKGDDATRSLVNDATAPDPNELVDLWEYSPQILFVRNYSETSSDGIPALCRRGISRTDEDMGNVQCLVEGVEDLQFDFGLDTDGDFRVDRFASAPTRAELEEALLAKVYILMRSPNEVTGYTNNKSYQLGGIKTIDPNSPADGYYRRVYQSSVAIRNSEVFGRN